MTEKPKQISLSFDIVSATTLPCVPKTIVVNKSARE